MGMLNKNLNFWNFESSSKIDILIEGQHTRQILRALADRETRIQTQGKDFIFYGNSEALLVQPRSFYLRFSIILVHHLATILQLT